VGRKRVSLGIRLGLIMRCPWDRDLEEKRSAFNQDKVKRATNLLKELFYITAELDAPVETLRHQIVQELAIEGLYSIGIYKVSGTLHFVLIKVV
jgi:hypothetical protein